MVRDFLMGVGLAVVSGDWDGVFSGCQRSRTDALRMPVGLLGSSFAARGELCISLTMFCTKPRPCSRLMLGVGSFCAGGFRKAGEAFADAGIVGPSEVRGEG